MTDPDRRVGAFVTFAAAYCGLRVEPFQRLIVGELFAGRRELVVLLPRGNGKTSLFAALALWHLVTHPRPAVYVAAASRDQARLTFDLCRRAVRGHPELSARITTRWNELRAADGFLRVLSSDAPRAHGTAPSLVLVDELHAHRTPDLYVAMRTALGKVAGAQLAVISTAGHDREGVLFQLREKALALPDVAEAGRLTTARDPHGAFALLEWACRPGDDLADPAAVKAANPASFVTERFLADQLAAPGLHPLEFARYHANVWTDTQDAWLPAGAWEACHDAAAVIDPGERVWVGVDIGGQRAATAVVAVTADLRCAAWTWTGDGAVRDARAQVEALADGHDVAEVAFDPWRFKAQALDLQDRGVRVVEFPQSVDRMVPASERLYAAIVEGRLRHPGDKVLTAHVRATAALPTPRGWRIGRRTVRAQNDGAIALAMAVDRAEAAKGAGTFSVVGYL